ncbi:MAG: FAD-binding oxidoreductase [Candidatus Binatia bacterium]
MSAVDLPQGVAIDGVVPSRVADAATVDEVRDAVRATAAAGGSLIACGRGRHLDVGEAPARCDLLLRVTGLSRIREHHAADMTITVDAGCTLAAIDAALAAEGQWLGLDAPAPDDTTVGGFLATNLSGPLRASHGTARDLLLGLRWISAQGELVAAGGKVVKNVAGYDLHKAHVGALGTLGVLVEATFKVRPRPPHERALIVACADPRGAVAAALDARDAVEPAWLEAASGGVLGVEGPAAIAVGWLGIEPELDDAERRVRARLATVDGTSVVRALADAEAVALRRRLADFCLTPAAAMLRVATLPAALGDALASVSPAAAESSTARWTAHAANGVARVLADDASSVARLVADTRPRLERAGGSLVVERATPDVKHALSAHGGVFGDPGPGRELMRRLKDAFDPGRVLSPGRHVAGI